MNNGINFGAIACGPATSREGERGSSETLISKFNVNKFNASPSPSPPGTEPSVQAVMSL